jgi:hypothetical protein
MPSPEFQEANADAELPPPGSRWGSGAHSVLPYLARSLQARPLTAVEPRVPQPRPPGPRGGDRPGAQS